MVKAADALEEFGYDVRVISVLLSTEGSARDKEIASTRRWRWAPSDLRRRESWGRWLRAALRQRAASLVSEVIGATTVPRAIVDAAYSRTALEIVARGAEEPADLIYAGTNSALVAGPALARLTKTPFALDLEDLHSHEVVRDARTAARLDIAARLERAEVPRACFVTAGSDLIAAEYERTCATRVIPIHNVVHLPKEMPRRRRESVGPRRLYWFSQTIGPDRGLEPLINALGHLRVAAALTLQGSVADGYKRHLFGLQERSAPHVVLRVIPPCQPDELWQEVREHHIGLALEYNEPRSRALCLTNKALLYPAAGLPVILSDTPGQRRFALTLGAGALLLPSGEPAQVAQAISRWIVDDSALNHAASCAWDSAVRRWHWEHDLERGALLRAVRECLTGPNGSSTTGTEVTDVGG